VGHLFPHERERLDTDGWAEKLGVAPYVRLGREWVLNKREDGACVFLDDENLCRIHAEFGEEAKPLACRIFPFSVRRSERGWQATLRFDCPSVTDSRGESISSHQKAVQVLVDSLPDVPKHERVRLKGRLVASVKEMDGLMSRLVRLVDRNDLPVRKKFVVFAQLASALAEARLKKVRGDRFLELVDLLIGGFAAGTEESAQTPTSTPTSTPTLSVSQRQRAMARQFVLACSEHVSLAELKTGVIVRWRKRSDQLAMARQFLRGSGVVPPLRGFSKPVTFDDVEQVQQASQDVDEIEGLLLRYVRARLTGDSVFGAGYYGWPVTSGLGALSMGVVAIGWVARYIAVHEGRKVLTFSDVSGAVRVIDRGVTRVRALGTVAERGRIAFLMQEEGLAGLVQTYWPVEMQ
jgi:lysine-N-methylase